MQLADAESTWLALSSTGSFAVDPETASRYEAAVAEARGNIERFDRELAEQRAAAERRASERAAKETLCQQVEGVVADDALGRVERARAEWEGLAAQGDSADAVASDPDLLARFEAACRRATERHANRQAIEQAQGAPRRRRAGGRNRRRRRAIRRAGVEVGDQRVEVAARIGRNRRPGGRAALRRRRGPRRAARLRASGGRGAARPAAGPENPAADRTRRRPRRRRGPDIREADRLTRDLRRPRSTRRRRPRIRRRFRSASGTS